MPEPKSNRISLTLYADMLKWIDKCTEDGKFTRSEVLGEILKVSREQTKVFGKALMQKKSRKLEQGERVKVLFSVSDDDMEWLDSISEGASVSKSEIVTEMVSAVSAQTELLNRIGLTGIRRRRIARFLGEKSDFVSRDKEEERKEAAKPARGRSK